MEFHRIIAAGTVVLILVITLASGPLVGLSLTAEAEQFEPRHGGLNATVVSTPDKATLEAARYGVEKFYLRAPLVEVRVHEIEGQPTLAYEIVIQELGYTRSSASFLDKSFQGEYDLKFAEAELNAQRIDQSQYEGALRVVHIDSGRILVEKNITIEVLE